MARSGAAISLDSAAGASGLTKPGLMYHFPTKAALVTAMVDRLMDTYEAELSSRLPQGATTDAAVSDRLLAYVDWVCEGDFGCADLLMFTDPRLREPLTTRWSERIEPWLVVPDDLPARRRTTLLAARLIADGIWFATASNAIPLSAEERDHVRELARQMIKETS